VQRAPGIPCALCSQRRKRICKTSGETSRENVKLRLMREPASAHSPITCEGG
jgi:hypothetical protein